jgi:hypothetical protein
MVLSILTITMVNHLMKKLSTGLGVMVHTYNPSHLGSRGRKIKALSSIPSIAKKQNKQKNQTCTFSYHSWLF